MESNWPLVTIDDLQAAHKGAIAIGPFGSRMKSDCYVETGIPVIRGTNITGGSDLDGEFVYISEEMANSLGACNVYQNDLVFPHRGSIGEVGIITDNRRYVISSSLMKLTCDETKAYPKFIYYFFKSPIGKYELLKNSSQVGTPGIGQPLSSLKSITLRLPPLEIQGRIIQLLSSLDNKILINRQINQTLEQMAQTLFKSWFVDFDPVIDNALDAGNDIPDTLQERAEQRRLLRAKADFKPLPAETRALFPSEFEETELGWVPKGWEYQSFEQSLNNTIGGDWGSEVEDIKHTQKTKIVRGTDIPELISGRESSAPTRWVESKKFASREIKAGDIIIEVSGGSPTQPTGRSIFMSQEIIDRLGGKVVPASFCRRFEPKSIPLGLLASIHLNKIYAEGKTWEYQNQSTGIANFQTKYFLEAEQLLIPNHEVLAQFHELVMPLITKAHNSEQIMLAKVRDTLLPKLISGELVLDALPELPALAEAR